MKFIEIAGSLGGIAKKVILGDKQRPDETQVGPSPLAINIHSPNGVIPVGMGGGGESMGAIGALQTAGLLNDEAAIQLIYRELVGKGLLNTEEVAGIMGASKSKALVDELAIVTSPINGRFGAFRGGWRAFNIKRNLRRATRIESDNRGFIL